MRRAVPITAVIGLALVAATAAGTGILRAPAAAAGSPAASPGASNRPTATVARQSLAEHDTLTGALGYPAAAPLKSGLPGTVTRLPAEGTVLTRGQPTIELDGQPTGFLLDGSRPAWRDLGPGTMPGADVLQLKDNLRALGYLPAAHARGSGWDDATTAAVKRWQRHLNLKVTGRLPLGSIVFRSGPVRVGTLDAALGDSVAPGSAMYEVTDSVEQITASLRADRRRLVHAGDKVGVLLPGGATATGTIRSVGAVAKQSPDGSASTIELTIALDDATVAAGYDRATVSVDITSQVAKDVLVVPVTALVALRGGGYAVEVVQGATSALVQVQPGMFANGLVEVSGSGLAAGDTVVVAE